MILIPCYYKRSTPMGGCRVQNRQLDELVVRLRNGVGTHSIDLRKDKSIETRNLIKWKMPTWRDMEKNM